MKPKIILRDALIILILTFVGGFIIGLCRPMFKMSDQEFMSLIGLSNLLFSVIGFTIAGSLSPNQRWKHLLLVTLCVWPMGLINLFFGIPVIQWVISILPLLITMAIGGAISYLFAKGNQSE